VAEQEEVVEEQEEVAGAAVDLAGGPPPLVPLGPNGLPLDYALAPALASDEYLV
jgi:hypothetical protein